jgi:hypothetical protein
MRLGSNQHGLNLPITTQKRYAYKYVLLEQVVTMDSESRILIKLNHHSMIVSTNFEELRSGLVVRSRLYVPKAELNLDDSSRTSVRMLDWTRPIVAMDLLVIVARPRQIVSSCPSVALRPVTQRVGDRQTGT